jgi:Na+/H+-dicarboxylate symporter
MPLPSPVPARFPLLVQLPIALVLGAVAGAAIGPQATLLRELALLFVKLLKLLATPLVFCAIVETFAVIRLPLRRALLLVGLGAVNALVAAGIALGLLQALPIGRFVDVAALRAVVVAPSWDPPRAVALFSRALDHLLVGNVLWVIAAALLVGVLARVARLPSVASLAQAGLGLVMRALSLLVRAAPLAVFGIMAHVAGTSGWRIFPVLGLFILLVAAGIALQLFGWYSVLLRWVARTPPGRFFRLASDALGTAMAVGSSLATLPVTLRTLERMQVSNESARLAAVVGTNLNHDGIVLYEAAAAVFVAQLYGLDLTLAQKLQVMLQSVVAAVGIAGVPEAGLMTLSLVLGSVGLPLAAVPLLLPVDWLLGRLRATANVTSDLVVANLVDRLAPHAPVDNT